MSESAAQVEAPVDHSAPGYRLSIRKILISLAAIVLILTILGAISMFVPLILGSSIYGTVIHGSMLLFDLGLDGNIPTWYASASLLLCALLLLLIARTAKGSLERWRKHWYGLSGLFLLFSIDETATIHERAGNVLNQLSPTAQGMGGFFYYSWVFIGAAAVLVVSFVFLRFTLSLPGRTRTLFVLAAVVFVSGGLGVEMINAWLHDSYGTETIAYVAMTVVEELLEMTGVLIFIYSLLDLLRAQSRAFNIQLAR